MKHAVVLSLLALVIGCQDPVEDLDIDTVAIAAEASAEEASAEPCCAIDIAEEDAAVEDEVAPTFDILPSAIQRGQFRRQWTGRIEISRDQIWNVPEGETGLEATILGLHRIGGTEVEWMSENDIIGIWQVAGAVRSRSCNRALIRQITECDADGETMISALRRLSSRAMGVLPPSHSRQRWIRNVDLSCVEPEGFPAGRSWTTPVGRGRPSLQEGCQTMAEVVRGLVTGRDTRRVTGAATPIAWGGRCEVDGGACDDRMACRRGLARIPNTGTQNALWCRVGTRGCANWVVGDNGIAYSDPVCEALGAPPLRTPDLAEVIGVDEMLAESDTRS
jgi:hypothetical protein